LDQGDPRRGQGEFADRICVTTHRDHAVTVSQLRAGQGKKILYDGERGQITNMADANPLLTREYRPGWAI
jgi:hypothetical protein